MTLQDDAIWQAINLKTKPMGSLGILERVAFKLAKLQGSLEPEIKHPTLLVFAGDHGIVEEGVSAYPSDVTWQMVRNYLNGGAAVNVFADLNDIDLKVIDAGVNHDFGSIQGLVNCKIAASTANFRHTQAMTREQLDACLQAGASLVRDLAATGCNAIGFGEMGIGNTSAAAVLMHCFCDLPIADCTGRGAGLDDQGLIQKTQILEAAVAHHGPLNDPFEILQTYAGFEMAMMTGAMLQAAEQGMLILVDGFIVTACLLAAEAISPDILDNCIFAHSSDEKGHRAMLQYLDVSPLLQLDLRLGEGTGAALAFPLVRAAAAFLRDMATFGDAGVSQSNA